MRDGTERVKKTDWIGRAKNRSDSLDEKMIDILWKKEYTVLVNFYGQRRSA